MTQVIEARAVISASDQTGKAFDAIAKKFKQLERGAKISAEVDRLSKSLARAESGMKALDAFQSRRDAFTAARERFRQAQGAVEAAARAMKLAEKPTRDLEQNLNRAQRAVSTAAKAFDTQKQAMIGATRAVKDFGVPVARMAAEQERMKRSVEATSVAIDRQLRREALVEKHAGRWRGDRQQARARRGEEAADVAARSARAQREYDHHIGRHGVVRAGAAAAAGAVSVHSIGHEIVQTVKAGARYQHEEVALRNAGRTPEEIHEIEEASHRTSRLLPTATFEENLKVINETTGAFGSLHHAIENLPFMQMSASVLHSAAGDKIHDSAGELGNKLARFFEIRQVAGDTPRFQREAEGLVRAMAFTRGNFNPAEAMNFAQQAKSALPNYSEHFLTRVAPSLVTEFGGDRAGTAANAFNSIITGKVNDKKQAEEWLRYGLLDPKQTTMKAGHAVGWRAGAVKETNLALSDPDRWAKEVALPAMRAKGVKVDDRLELTKVLATMFRNVNGNMFANAIMQAASVARLEKDDQLMGKAGTLKEIYSRNLETDPTVSVTALKAGIEDLMVAASSPAMKTAAEALTALGSALQGVALAAKDHPTIALGAGAALGGGALAGAGWLTYQISTGFGLPASAVELTVAAKALDSAAVRLGSAGTIGAGTAAGGAVGGTLSKLGRLARLGVPALLGVGAIAGTIAALDYVDPNDNTGTGRGYQRKRGPKLSNDWALGQDVSRGLPFDGTGYNSDLPRQKSWTETLFGRASFRGGPADTVPMRLPSTGYAALASLTPMPSGTPAPGIPLPPARPWIDQPAMINGRPSPLDGASRGLDLSGKLEAKVIPDQIQANVKPDQVSAKLEGQGVIVVRAEPGTTITNTSSSGNIALRSAGTSMGTRVSTGPGGIGGI